MHFHPSLLYLNFVVCGAVCGSEVCCGGSICNDHRLVSGKILAIGWNGSGTDHFVEPITHPPVAMLCPFWISHYFNESFSEISHNKFQSFISIRFFR
jgi:hypothetical protein